MLQRKAKRAFGRGVKGKIEHDVGRLQNFGKGRKRAVSAAADAGSVAASSAGMAYLGAALSAGLACIGAGIAVASGASAAIGAVSEDPKSFGKALIFVVLGEGIAIYGLLIAILILNRV